MTALFKPSEVFLTVPPLMATMKRAETEFAAALIVFACTWRGDAWQPIRFIDVREALKEALVQADLREALASSEPLSARVQWARDVVKNSFLRPDVHALIELGFAEKLPNKLPGEGEQPMVVQLTPAAFEAIAKRWVPGGAQL